MPSGGIEPFKRSDEPEENVMTIRDKLVPQDGGCWVCHHGGAFHMLHEWDAWIHARCAIDYLHGALHPREETRNFLFLKVGFGINPQDEEAQIITDSGYTVTLDFSLEEAP